MTLRGGTAEQRLQVANAMEVLGKRFVIRHGSLSRGGRCSIEIVEGDEETVYRIDARSVEQMCGMLLRKVFEDKAREARTGEIAKEVVFSADEELSGGAFREDLEMIIRETMSMKGSLSAFMKKTEKKT